MATKAFQGEVIGSEDGTFTDNKTGEAIVGWNITIKLTDELQKRFFISERNTCFVEAKSLVKGNSIILHADANPGFNDKVKWVPVQIEKSASKEPPF